MYTFQNILTLLNLFDFYIFQWYVVLSYLIEMVQVWLQWFATFCEKYANPYSHTCATLEYLVNEYILILIPRPCP